MFSGIVQTTGKIKALDHKHNLLSYAVKIIPHKLFDFENIKIGDSISIDGACQTVTKIDFANNLLYFDAVLETLNKTIIQDYQIDQIVNLETALKMGEPIGGHLLSGHVYATAIVKNIEYIGDNCADQKIITIQTSPELMDYILPKGYIGINGASLTINNPKSDNTFELHLIPETLDKTNLAYLQENHKINLEIDFQTQTIVTTVKKYLKTI